MDLASSEQNNLQRNLRLILSQAVRLTDNGYSSARCGKASGAFGKFRSPGTPEQLSDKSPPGRQSRRWQLLALRYFDEQAQTNKIAVIPFAGGAPVKTLEVWLASVMLGWDGTADSRAIVYADARGDGESNADNIWTVLSIADQPNN